MTAYLDLGPQRPGDNPFGARMRLHQSWYRASVLGVPWGTGPYRTSTTKYGNMLRRNEGAKGCNFLSSDIHNMAAARIADPTGAVEEFRLLHNMLSSQPMCFNLFGPLAADRELATRFLRATVGDHVKQTTRVAIEWAPEPSTEYLNDRTAFDAFMEYETVDGSRGFVGIETKLTEPFSRKVYDSPAYRRWVEHDQSPWPQGSWDRLQEKGHNQLWRDHLLAEALLLRNDRYSEGQLWLVSHSLDTICKTAAANYRSLLKDECKTFREVGIDEVVGFLSEAASEDAHRDWLNKFRERYLDLSPSEPFVTAH